MSALLGDAPLHVVWVAAVTAAGMHAAVVAVNTWPVVVLLSEHLHSNCDQFWRSRSAC